MIFTPFESNATPGASQEGIELAAAPVFGLRFHDYSDFDEGRRGDFAGIRFADRLGEHSRIGLGKQNGQNGGAIDDHFGKPSSS